MTYEDMEREARCSKYVSLSAEVEKCVSRLETLRSYLEGEIIGGLYLYARDEERIEKIREEMERGDFTLLTTFITQVLEDLAPTETSLQEAEKATKEIRSSSIELTTDCEKSAIETKSKKDALSVGTIMIATAGGLLGIGATIGGANTVGLYLPAVIGITACSVMATHYFSSKYEMQEKEFRELSQLLDKVMSSTSSILDNIFSIQVNLEAVSNKIYHVNQAMDAHETPPSCLVSTFDRLCHSICLVGVSAYHAKAAIKACNEGRLNE